MQIRMSSRSLVAAAVLAIASASAGAATTFVTPPSPTSTPTAGDNGSLLLAVWDATTQRSLVLDLGLTINNIKPGGTTDMTTPGTVLDFGSLNLGSYGISSGAQYMVLAADFAPPAGGCTPGDTTCTPSIIGNNLYVTGNLGSLTDADRSRVQTEANAVSSYLGNANKGIFNRVGLIQSSPGVNTTTQGCAGANPCATINPADPRYIGPTTTTDPITGDPVNNPAKFLAFLDGSSATGSATLGSALNFWQLLVTTDNTDPTGADEHLGKTQYAGQFLLDADGHLTYSVSAVPLPAAGWLLISGLLGMGTIGRRRNPAGAAA